MVVSLERDEHMYGGDKRTRKHTGLLVKGSLTSLSECPECVLDNRIVHAFYKGAHLASNVYTRGCISICEVRAKWKIVRKTCNDTFKFRKHVLDVQHPLSVTK